MCKVECTGFLDGEEGHASKTRLAQLRALDAKLWHEMFGEFGTLQGPNRIELQSVEGQASRSFEADQPCRWAETQRSGKLSMVSATAPPPHSSLAEAMSVARELHLSLVRSESGTHRLQVELAHAEAHFETERKQSNLQKEQKRLKPDSSAGDETQREELNMKSSVFSTELARLEGEQNALDMKTGAFLDAEFNLFDSLHDDFCRLLWLEECSADAAARPASDSGPRSHSGIAAVALAIRLLRAQLEERSDEATRLCSELADAKVTAAAQLAGLRHELQKEQDAFKVERAEINAQLERAWGDRKDLVRQTELLHANMSVYVQREKSAVEAMTAERRASQKLKHAVSVAAAEFSRRLGTHAQDDDANG